MRLDLRRDEPSEVPFAAFYADCLHEVLPVVSGYRLALIYNLIRTGEDQLLGPPDDDREHLWAVKLRQAWGTPAAGEAGESAEPALTMRIPAKAATRSEGKWPLVLIQSGQSVSPKENGR